MSGSCRAAKKPLHPKKPPPDGSGGDLRLATDATPVDAALAPDTTPVDAAPAPDGSPQCAVDCDCPQGQACQGGSCVPLTPGAYCCTKPGCMAGWPCTNPDGSKGTCPGGGPCKTHCDCQQGFTCVSGGCMQGPPVYCCAKPGCPGGATCFNPSGTQGTCP